MRMGIMYLSQRKLIAALLFIIAAMLTVCGMITYRVSISNDTTAYYSYNRLNSNRSDGEALDHINEDFVTDKGFVSHLPLVIIDTGGTEPPINTKFIIDPSFADGGVHIVLDGESSASLLMPSWDMTYRGGRLISADANDLIEHLNPLAVEIDVHQRVAIVATAHIQGPDHHTVDAVGLIESPRVIMATLVGDNRILLEDVHIGAVVVQIIKYRIMIDAQHPHSRLDHHVQSAVQPQEVLLLDVTVAHLHERATVHAHHHEIIYRKDKTVAAPQVVEGLAGALAPVVLVIAGDDVQRMGNAVEDGFDIAQLLVAALVGEVTGHHHGINIGRVNLGHGFAQLTLIGITRGDMNITQDGQPDHPSLQCQRHCHCSNEKHQSFHLRQATESGHRLI